MTIVKNIFLSFHYRKLCRVFEKFWRLRHYLGIISLQSLFETKFFFSGTPFKFLSEKMATLPNP